jgi:predicted RNA-binding protein YlqC (UPF0109 family)
MPEETQDQQFVAYIVQAIVDHPEDVKVERSLDELGTLVSLYVNPDDMGTIIGKEGRTAKALRTLLRVLGAKNNARVNLKIIEPEGGRMLPQLTINDTEARLAAALQDLPQDELA